MLVAMIAVDVALALALGPPRGEAPPAIDGAAIDDGPGEVGDDAIDPGEADGASEPGDGGDASADGDGESDAAQGPELGKPPYAGGSSHVPSPVAPPPRTPEPHPGVIGGYWDMDRTQGPEPDDGREEIIVGSILVPLGIIAVSSSAATIWLSAPGHCTERWKALGAEPTADQCKGVRVFGIIRVAYGSLMVTTGSVLLGIGTHRREKNRKWHRGQALTPWFGEGAGGLVYGGRFGGRRF